MKRPKIIVVPYHQGTYKGQKIYCLHTDFDNFCILYDDRMVFSKKCLIPKIKLIPKSPFHGV